MAKNQASKREVREGVSVIEKCIDSVNAAHDRLDSVEKGNARAEHKADFALALAHLNFAGRLRWLFRGI